MTATAFDTLKAAKTLKNGGFTEEQADAQVEVHMQVTNGLATKKDLEEAIKSLVFSVGSMLAGAVGLTVILITFLDQVVFIK